MSDIEKQHIFFIEDGTGSRKLAHCRKGAHEWLDSLLDRLEKGTLEMKDINEKERAEYSLNTEQVDFEHRYITKAEIDAILKL